MIDLIISLFPRIKFVLLLAVCTALHAGEQPSLGSGTSAEAEQIPSAWWPQFVETVRDLDRSESNGQQIEAKTRGVLLRAEGDRLIVDFGRKGIVSIEPKATSFYNEVYKLMTGESEKEFPNFALQVGNKMMTFGRGKNSGPIRFREALGIDIYLLLYLDTYQPEIAQDLMDLGEAYKDLKEERPDLEIVLMPRDRKFYDFGATVGYVVPYIAPHMRKGYIHSLSHGVDLTPAFVAVDDNGRMLYRSDAPLDWGDLSNSLENLVNELGIPWSKPKLTKRKAYQRTAAWNN